MVFGIGQFNYASHIWLGPTLVAMATKICDSQHKIGYNSACAGDKPQILAPSRGFSGSASLMMSVKLCSDGRCCHGNEKLLISPKNLPQLRLYIGWSRNFWFYVWLSVSTNSTMRVTFGSDIRLLPWQPKFAIFNTKSAIT